MGGVDNEILLKIIYIDFGQKLVPSDSQQKYHPLRVRFCVHSMEWRQYRDYEVRLYRHCSLLNNWVHKFGVSRTYIHVYIRYAKIYSKGICKHLHENRFTCAACYLFLSQQDGCRSVALCSSCLSIRFFSARECRSAGSWARATNFIDMIQDLVHEQQTESPTGPKQNSPNWKIFKTILRRI